MITIKKGLEMMIQQASKKSTAKLVHRLNSCGYHMYWQE
jgi:hypothetical protein